MVMVYTLTHDGVHWAWNMMKDQGQPSPRKNVFLRKNTTFAYSLVSPPILSCAMLSKPVGPFTTSWSFKESGRVFFYSFIKKEFFQTLVPLVIRNLLATFDLSLLLHKLNSFVLVSTLSSGALDNDAFIHTLSVSVYKQRAHPSFSLCFYRPTKPTFPVSSYTNQLFCALIPS